MCAFICVCVCVCVCMNSSNRKIGTLVYLLNQIFYFLSGYVCVCVCACACMYI